MKADTPHTFYIGKIKNEKNTSEKNDIWKKRQKNLDFFVKESIILYQYARLCLIQILPIRGRFPCGILKHASELQVKI
jgi:hypothetical protein